MALSRLQSADDTSNAGDFSIQNMSTADQFTIDWLTLGNAFRYAWFAVAPKAGAFNQFDRTASDTITISEPSLTALETYARVPSTDSTTVTADTATRMLSAIRVPTTDTITITAGTVTR